MPAKNQLCYNKILSNSKGHETDVYKKTNFSIFFICKNRIWS